MGDGFLASSQLTTSRSFVGKNARASQRNGLFEDFTRRPMDCLGGQVFDAFSMFAAIDEGRLAYELLRELEHGMRGVAQMLNTCEISNLHAAPGYSQKTLNLTRFKGQSVTLQLVGIEENGSMTSFLVDDCAIVIEL